MNRLAQLLIASFQRGHRPQPPRVVSIDDLLHDRDGQDLDEHFDQARAVVEDGREPR